MRGPSGGPVRTQYTDGSYLVDNPTWDVEDSPWKVRQILRMIRRNHLAPRTICEVGCGAGEILRQLQAQMDHDCQFWGYEVSPQAFALCGSRANERLQFRLGDIREDRDARFDLILLIDVIEHVEDYFGFLRDLQPKSTYKILHIPLDLSVQSVLRSAPIMKLRRSSGHIHYFTKETALQALAESGYEVLDHFYTAGIELPARSFKGRVAKVPRWLFFAFHQDLAVRILGGYSLMVLVR